MAQILNTTYFLSVENDNTKWQIVEFSTIFLTGSLIKEVFILGKFVAQEILIDLSQFPKIVL